MDSRKWVLLDRDGVITEYTPGYIIRPKNLRLDHGAGEALKLFNDNGFSVIVITNQSCVGRKLASRAAIDAVNEKLCELAEESGGKITDVYVCPHIDADGCLCRKPMPGMILSASEKYRIPLSDTYFVGDSVTDLMAADNAGCSCIICLTGNPETEGRMRSLGLSPEKTVSSL